MSEINTIMYIIMYMNTKLHGGFSFCGQLTNLVKIVHCSYVFGSNSGKKTRAQNGQAGRCIYKTFGWSQNKYNHFNCFYNMNCSFVTISNIFLFVLPFEDKVTKTLISYLNIKYHSKLHGSYEIPHFVMTTSHYPECV